MSVALLIPAKRAHNIVPLVRDLAASTPSDWHCLVISDPEDAGIREAVLRANLHLNPLGLPLQNLDSMIVKGNYAAKVNAAVELTDEPLIFLGADDLSFHPGWLEAATAQLAPGIGVVGTQDLCNSRVKAGKHSTHSLVTREYAELGTIDEPDKLLHEGYPHEYVDDEFVQTAKHRDAFAFAHDSVVEHLHPMAGKAPTDELYDAQAERMKRGRVIFKRRERLWR